MRLALDRLDGRPAEILTNNTFLIRSDTYFTDGRWDPLPYYELANHCIISIARTSCSVRFVRTGKSTETPPTDEGRVIRWLAAQARADLFGRLDREVSP